ncbi:MAG: DUF1501 domain-containing protein [Akkermansiaceae bacterium]|nr:DUF1501 domain-containing protein [Akkermansiaceae bacterium]
MNRRSFLKTSALASLAGPALANTTHVASMPKGKAEHCIFIWLGGGMSQIDTFDPKRRGTGKKPMVAGSDYDSIPTVVPGVNVTEHLGNCAKLMDRMTAVRTVFHGSGQEHAIATNFVHTARPISGSTIYPSIGSIVAHQRGAANPKVPAYMLIGFPSVSRGPGFLGSKYGNIYLTDVKAGPAGFTRPEYLDTKRMDARKQLLEPITAGVPKDSTIADYESAQVEALRLAGPEFMRNFDLSNESSDIRNGYAGEFGERCLVARRLIQDGVRFVEVSHNPGWVNGTGWDTHNAGQLQQHVLIRELDQVLATLIKDLEQKKLLDKTLVVVATEFGRPPEFDGGGGRGHQASAFTMVLAGGGLNHKGAYGTTDELSKKIVENPVSTPDFHATIHAALGINPSHELMDSTRPVPITDGGVPIAALFG